MMVVAVLIISCHVFGKMKRGSGHQPDDDDENSYRKCPGAAENGGGTARKNTERVTDDTKEIAFLFVLVCFSDLEFSCTVSP